MRSLRFGRQCESFLFEDAVREVRESEVTRVPGSGRSASKTGGTRRTHARCVTIGFLQNNVNRNTLVLSRDRLT